MQLQAELLYWATKVNIHARSRYPQLQKFLVCFMIFQILSKNQQLCIMQIVENPVLSRAIQLKTNAW